MKLLLLGMGWFPDQPGGLNRYVRGLSTALSEAGEEARATVIGPGTDAPAAVDAVVTPETPLSQRLSAYRSSVRRHLADADLVDAHFALYALPALLGSRCQVPLVVHFHGPWAAESRVEGEGRLATLVKAQMERRLYARADAFVVLSHAFKRVLIETYGVVPWHVHVIPPGVELARYSPGDMAEARRRLELPEDSRVVLCVRRLVQRMGVDMLIAAWSWTPRAPGDILVIVGEGPERKTLESVATGHGVAGSVRFVGRVKEDELPLYYRAADVCVAPSAALEGFGLVVLESLASGTPVIVSDVGGLPEAVEALEKDLVVEPTADALARRLAQELPSRANCRRHAERFSWTALAERHLDLYRRLVARAEAGPRPLRVVYLDHTATLSGGELALLRLLPALEGVEPHVVLAEDGPLVRKLLAAGISAEVLPMDAGARATRRDRLGPGSAIAAIAYAVRLARRLRKLEPDLVHANSLKACLYGGVAARVAGVPAVWHVRDRIAADYLPPFTASCIRRLARVLPSAVVANSRATLTTLPPLRIAEVVPSPIARMRIASRRNGDRLCVGMLGRIAPWKGQHVFVQALALAFPDGGADGLVVGAPLFGRHEEEYFEQVKALASAQLVPFEFTGFADDVEAQLARMHILVHASVIPEPFGQAVVQGMAAGLPVVAARDGGPSELIEDGVDGLLYQPGDATELAARLRQLGADANLRARLGAAAREKADGFGPERVAARILDVYRAVLAA